MSYEVRLRRLLINCIPAVLLSLVRNITLEKGIALEKGCHGPELSLAILASILLLIQLRVIETVQNCFSAVSMQAAKKPKRVGRVNVTIPKARPSTPLGCAILPTVKRNIDVTINDRFAPEINAARAA